MVVDVEFIENVQAFDVEFGESINVESELEAQIEALEQEKQQLTDEVTALNAEVAEKQEQIDVLLSQIRDKEHRIAELETQIAELQQDVAEAFEAGKKSEYDLFWDVYQSNYGIDNPEMFGKRTNYAHAFSGYGWDDTTYKPKYPIIPTNAEYMFAFSRISYADIDFSRCTNVNDILSYAYGMLVFTIDVSNCKNTTIARCFRHSALHTLDLTTDETIAYNGIFTSTTKLTNLTITGTIGQNGFNVKDCTKLTHDSLMSIINALKDYSGSEQTYTITLGTTNLDKLSTEEKAIAQGKGWTLV